ncbi:hypothetical protein ACFVH7_31855 [Kitasatospora indigofera]|uniref:hypothetical protein n=1 Tax=Kitasatospora indigofera TaxID=67307 RepID=UPI00362A37C9
MAAAGRDAAAQMESCAACLAVRERTPHGGCAWPCPDRPRRAADRIDELLRVPPDELELPGSAAGRSPADPGPDGPGRKEPEPIGSGWARGRLAAAFPLRRRPPSDGPADEGPAHDGRA